MSNLSVFKFEALEVRAVVIDGAPWFVASDVCAALGHTNTSKAVADHVHDDDKSNHSLGLPGSAPTIVNESGLYALIFGSRLESAQKFKRWVTSEVLPSIRKTGGYSEQNSLSMKAKEELELLNMAADYLRVAPSSRLQMIGGFMQLRAPDMAHLLPAYAVDAPTGSTEGSSKPTAAATALLKEHCAPIGAATFNKLLESEGYLETRTRKSTSGATKSYKAVTAKGMKYGKNITSPNNPRETQPHWYVASFGELLDMVYAG